MKLVLDEMLSPAIASQLRDKGDDVAAIKGNPEWEGLEDPDVMNLAREQQRAVVTNNIRDYRPLHHQAISPGGSGDYGMVFMSGPYRRTKDHIGKIVDALEEKLDQYPEIDALADAETWL